MIYINFSGKGPHALAVQGSADDIIAELTTLLIELQESDRGLTALADADRASVDPEVKKAYKDVRINLINSEREYKKDEEERKAQA